MIDCSVFLLRAARDKIAGGGEAVKPWGKAKSLIPPHVPLSIIRKENSWAAGALLFSDLLS